MIAGFGYTFFNPEIRKFGHPVGIDEFSGRIKDMLSPLLFEPGTKFNYGASPSPSNSYPTNSLDKH
jgi:hypothetical protein